MVGSLSRLRAGQTAILLPQVVIHSRFISGTNPGNRIGGHHAKGE
jgi:hypothetical protein